MLNTVGQKPLSFSATRAARGTTNTPLNRKLWLPKFVYDAIPYFYIVSGLAAFLATLYVSEWFWVLPHYLLFSIACVHLGVVVYIRRREH
jgi:hypothetical protein